MEYKQPLKDTFGRVHDYLRISLIDACNFSCTYCVPSQKPEKKLHSSLMTADEIGELASIFVSLGVNKIRLTGGEPLLRKDFPEILNRLSRFDIELTLTTNGFLIDKYIEDLKRAGVKSLNVSLDTFNAEKFHKISGFDGFAKVYQNIITLIEEGFHVKLNIVLMRGVNDDEILDFISFSKKLPVHIRFIEYMPFSDNNWNRDKVISSGEILETVESHYEVIKLPDAFHDTARKYKVIGCEGTLAMIGTVSDPFCSGCNRMRLTADGKMRNCLFAQTHSDLLTPLRKGEDVLALIRDNILTKYEKYGGQQMNTEIKNSNMILIGG